MKKSLSIIFFLFFIAIETFAQTSLVFPSDYNFGLGCGEKWEEYTMADLKIQKPVIYLSRRIERDSNTVCCRCLNDKPCLRGRIFNQHLINLETIDTTNGAARFFSLYIDPVFNFSGGMDLKDTAKEKLYTNSRGLWVQGNIGEKIRYETVFFENQSTLANYADDYATSVGIVPGQSRYKAFKTNGYDYGFAAGAIQYTKKWFTLKLGQGKEKIGEGYRSVFLSDNSSSYPFINLSFSKFNGRNNFYYLQKYAVLTNLSTGGAPTPFGTEHLYQKKAASFQYFKYSYSKSKVGFSLSAFQGLVATATDSMNRFNLNSNYFNPLIGANALAFGLKAKNNVIVGLATDLTLLKAIRLYSQFAIDDVVAKKFANQFGIKYYNAFTINGLFLQAEFNKATARTYAATDVAQSYSNYNQALAHPIGNNFREIVAIANYQYRCWFLFTKFNMIQPNTNGTSVLISDQVPFVLTETARKISNMNLNLGYVLNAKTKANISFSYTLRKDVMTGLVNTEKLNSIFMISFKTSLYNAYWDF